MKKLYSLRLFHIVLIILISLGIGYGFGRFQISMEWKEFRPIVSIQNQNPPEEQVLDMGLFYTVLEEINKEYYDKSKIDTTKMLHGAISGMLSSLDDPYTAFFPPKENDDFKTQLSGEFSGIGAELSLSEDSQLMVVSPLDGSPAKAAGIRVGDLILKVNGDSTFGWDVPKAVETIRGERGTKVTLNILHEDSKEAQDIEITRDIIEIDSVTSWFRSFSCNGENCTLQKDCKNCMDVAYLRLSQFGEKTNDEWGEKINELMPQISSSQNFGGVIVDVRSNPGGILNDAVYVASEFIKPGKTVVIQEDGQGRRLPLTVERRGVMLDMPVIVLTNQGSASASEILAGALHDHNRAQILGEKTFGKGTIQQPVDLEDGKSSVHISVAKWLTPNGIWVNEAEGLEPDILVEYDASSSADMVDEELDNQLIRAIYELSQ